ncbi:DUF2075 domain-containing protein [Nocardiopsis alba]|uniref:DUF2075 domain-containing protein n=1 Tax=Nocardiopsis alba TaxID=53437 RepID=A0A7K2IXT9_9ACTN|nr:DUF2075 domain-containing protein [Nocardiopsis alba]MYR34666.1 DUF2075 domain-containing protein [Nocardiopsis alba]
MYALRLSARELHSLSASEIEEKTFEGVKRMLRRSTAVAESRSWANSLPVLADDLIRAGLDQIEVLIEYSIPGNSERADAVLAGTHPSTGKDSFLVVELKQWREARLLPDHPGKVDVTGVPGRKRDHPGPQVEGYCGHMREKLACLHEDSEALRGVLYLHNALREQVEDLYKNADQRYGMVFSSSERNQFTSYLRSRFTPASGAASADRLLGSMVRPTRSTTQLSARQIARRSQFNLLREQEEAYLLALRTAEEARADDHKRIVVVTGGPGSGKSAVAVELLGAFMRGGYNVRHATGSSAFTETLRSVVAGGPEQKGLRDVFGYFSGYTTARRNDVDVLICDEAHRLREKSDSWTTRKNLRSDRPQIEELVNAARVPVFLLDDHQVIRPTEIGSFEEIQRYAKQRGIEVRHVQLNGLFRSGGSVAYDAWVKGVLRMVEAEPFVWEDDGAFSLRLADSPSEMEQCLRELTERKRSARLTAGYCWSWTQPGDDGLLPSDVRIGDWSMPWNNKQDKAFGGAPPRALWATDPRGLDQVGCIYTAQGFEYDWAGIILGPDLKFHEGVLTTDNRKNKDRNLPQRLPAEESDTYIRNIYKVLLTRAMEGAIVYAVDPGLQKHLTGLVPSLRNAPVHVPVRSQG